MIWNGNNIISHIYRGGTELTAVYNGSTQIWRPPFCVVLDQQLEEFTNSWTIPRDGSGTYTSGSFEYNVPLSFETPDWFQIQNQNLYDSDSLKQPSRPTYKLLQWDANILENTGEIRTGNLIIKNSITNEVLKTITLWQLGITWTTNSCTCTASPTTYNTSYLNSMMVYTTSVTVTSYASQTSSEGGSRTVEITPTASISNTNIITGVSFTKTATNTYKMTVGYKRNVSGNSTVTITTAHGGKIDTATYTINVAQPVAQKTMTLAFRQATVQKVFLFSGIASTNLATSTLKGWNITSDDSTLRVSWTSTLEVNSPTGGRTQISEGQQFYVYYSTSNVSYINQCVLSSTQPTLEAGSTVQIL